MKFRTFALFLPLIFGLGLAPQVAPAANTVSGIDMQIGDQLGIGTNAPGNLLDVAGTVQMDGLRIDVTPTAKTITCTHTITISANGTNYEIPCAAA